MEMNHLMSVLIRQIDAAKNHAGLDPRRREDPTVVDAILRSLRLTTLALSTGLDPWKDAPHLFLLTVTEGGSPVLSQAGAAIPVNEPFLAYLFWTAGIDLEPGQLVLLEGSLANVAIEEALSRVALDLAFAEREWATRRALMETAASLPRPEELEALRALEERTNLLWDRKIELLGASLIAEDADPASEAA